MIFSQLEIPHPLFQSPEFFLRGGVVVHDVVCRPAEIINGAERLPPFGRKQPERKLETRSRRGAPPPAGAAHVRSHAFFLFFGRPKREMSFMRNPLATTMIFPVLVSAGLRVNRW